MFKVYYTGAGQKNNDFAQIQYRSFKFSGGEIQVKLEGNFGHATPSDLTIDGNIHSADDLFELALLTDAIRRAFRFSLKQLHLITPYLPYARQDRVCAPGEALSLKVVSAFINSLNFNSVEIWDVHSDVALALLNNVSNRPQYSLLHSILPMTNTVLVSPDAGAVKKTLQSAKRYKMPMIEAMKHRDTHNGEITGTSVNWPEHFQISDEHNEPELAMNFLIVDDICDGGRTFIELAKVLKPVTQGKVMLYVTHGIMSKGFEPLMEVLDHIYVANPLFSALNYNESHSFYGRVAVLEAK